MGLGVFINKNNISAGSGPAIGVPQDLSTITDLNYQDALLNYTTFSKQFLVDDLLAQRDIAYENVMGKPFDLDSVDWYKNMRQREKTSDVKNKAKDQIVEQLRKEDPTKYWELRTTTELRQEAPQYARLEQQRLDELRSQAEAASDPFVNWLGKTVGSIGGVAVDPVNLATLPLGAGGKTVLGFALREAGLNMTVEAATQPAVTSWQREIGNEYGVAEILENVAFAGLFGGAAGAVIKGARPTARAVFDAASNIPKIGEKARRILKRAAREAHIEDANLGRVVSDKGAVNAGSELSVKHRQAANIALDKLSKGQKLKPNDLPVKEADLLTLETKIKEGDSEAVASLKQEVAELQSIARKQGVKIEQRAAEKTVPIEDPIKAQSLIRRAEKAESNEAFAKNKTLSKEEREFVESNPTFVADVQAGKYTDQKRVITPRPTEPDLTPAQRREVNDMVEELQESGMLKREVSPGKIDEAIEDVDSSLVKDFDALVEADPNLKITTEDGQITISQLKKELEDDNLFLNEIKDCAGG